MPKFSIQASFGTMESQGSMEGALIIARHNLTTLASFLDANYGNDIVVRDDSKLSYNWAMGDIAADIADIAEEIAFIQLLSRTTDYHHQNEIVLRLLANGIKKKHPRLSWNTTWKIVKKYGPDLVKFTTVYDKWGHIPQLSKPVQPSSTILANSSALNNNSLVPSPSNVEGNFDTLSRC